MQRNGDLPPLEEWHVENLRLTAFPTPDTQISNPTWWADIVGETPESTVSKSKRGIWQQDGPFEGGELSLTIQPSRINWLFHSTQIDDSHGGPPIIGALPGLLDIFLSLMLRWLEHSTCPSLRRLAFGAVLLQPVEDYKLGFQLLSSYLPTVKLDPEGSSDFLYQINRPRNSSIQIDNLKINRLSKWSIITWRMVSLSAGVLSGQTTMGLESFLGRLELDINTSQHFIGEIPREQLPKIFQELVDLGKQIAREGDVP